MRQACPLIRKPPGAVTRTVNRFRRTCSGTVTRRGFRLVSRGGRETLAFGESGGERDGQIISSRSAVKNRT